MGKLTNCDTQIATAGNEKMKATAKARATVQFGDHGSVLELDKTIHLPCISEDLLSVSQLCDAGYRVEFTKKFCTVL